MRTFGPRQTANGTCAALFWRRAWAPSGQVAKRPGRSVVNNNLHGVGHLRRLGVPAICIFNWFPLALMFSLSPALTRLIAADPLLSAFVVRGLGVLLPNVQSKEKSC